MKYQKDCAHCPGGLGLKYPLYDDDLFWVVCDVHPLVEGHILIISKEHIMAMGALADKAFLGYIELYKKVKSFLESCYGLVGVFEHGIIGQTVFHAHTHFLPFVQDTEKIIPDKNALWKISGLEDIKKEFKKEKKYLFFENKNQMWLVDVKIGFPKFFRDIFGKLLGAKDRADWKKAMNNKELTNQFEKDISSLTKKWCEYKKEEG